MKLIRFIKLVWNSQLPKIKDLLKALLLCSTGVTAMLVLMCAVGFLASLVGITPELLNVYGQNKLENFTVVGVLFFGILGAVVVGTCIILNAIKVIKNTWDKA